MSVLLPLYVYPSPGAWDPLYNAAKAHADVEFTVIVNPCSGPCVGSLPDQVYLDEIPKLKTYENIRTLGYVATNYTTKSLNDVLAEIDQYAKWSMLTNNTKLRMDGIFFDETPSTFDPSKFAYLKRASEAVKNGTRFRDRFVVHNPGLIPTSILTSKSFLSQSYMNLSDITVVFEETFDKWIEKSTFDALQKSQARKSKSAVILHSLPTVSKTVVDWVVEQIGDAAGWIFLTNVKTKDEYYHNFSGLFNDMVKAMD
ncbi:Spherulation-specific family 4 [Clohesyomyces aquaticus]|uniref:Spherulation-specific family 4 n=1 Tax=Clohesyomyces aquaticus TaxID=1231657 RepID=A0A1Y1Y772_9PLEO|nr:Spherulation-specific family 4 [Clohesyomyces aquaticus]